MCDNDFPNPPTHHLTADEVNIIQETWKIPSANVSDEKKFHDKPVFICFYQRD